MFSVAFTTIPPRFYELVNRISPILKWKSVDKVYISVSHTYNRFPEWDNIVPNELLNLPDVVITRCDDYGPATKYLGVPTDIDQWVFVCDDDQDYQWKCITRIFARRVEHSDHQTVWQNGAEEEMKHGICGPIAGFKGLFVHSSVLKDLHDHPKHDAMRAIDDQWFLMFCTLNRISIKDTGLCRKLVFGSDTENVGDAALFIEKPRGRILHAYLHDNADMLVQLKDTTWKEWKVVNKTKFYKSPIRVIVIPIIPASACALRNVVFGHICSEEIFTLAEYVYYFIHRDDIHDISADVNALIQSFSKHRVCHVCSSVPDTIVCYDLVDTHAAVQGKFQIHSFS